MERDYSHTRKVVTYSCSFQELEYSSVNNKKNKKTYGIFKLFQCMSIDTQDNMKTLSHNALFKIKNQYPIKTFCQKKWC